MPKIRFFPEILLNWSERCRGVPAEGVRRHALHDRREAEEPRPSLPLAAWTLAAAGPAGNAELDRIAACDTYLSSAEFDGLVYNF